MFIQVKSFSNVCRFYQPNSKFVSKTNSDIKTQKCTSVTFILIKYRVVPSTVLEPSAWKRLGIKTRHILLYALFHSILQSCHDRKLKTIGSKNVQLLKGKKNHNLIHQIIFYHFYFFLYFRLLFYSHRKLQGHWWNDVHLQATGPASYVQASLQFHESPPHSQMRETHFLLLLPNSVPKENS